MQSFSCLLKTTFVNRLSLLLALCCGHTNALVVTNNLPWLQDYNTELFADDAEEVDDDVLGSHNDLKDGFSMAAEQEADGFDADVVRALVTYDQGRLSLLQSFEQHVCIVCLIAVLGRLAYRGLRRAGGETGEGS